MQDGQIKLTEMMRKLAGKVKSNRTETYWKAEIATTFNAEKRKALESDALFLQVAGTLCLWMCC